MREVDGRVAVVTGAASGMGRAFAERFAQEGMKVVLADIEREALDVAVVELRQQERDVIGVVADVSQQDAVRNILDEALAAYGKVHVVCNNAGVAGGGAGTLWDATLDDWRWIMGVNLWGVVHGVRTFVPQILRQGEGGHVVNTASVAGLLQGGGIYGVTKHAVVALSEALYQDLLAIDPSVGVTVLCPGLINTRITESARNRPPELGGGDWKPGQPRSPFALLLEQGMDPAEVARQVFQAIQEQQLYLVTDHDFDDRIQQRWDNIAARRNPAPRARLV
jgi:NAD(P)-dependent dehydrogenase (short-subunit alcohol dehydrogenase family)